MKRNNKWLILVVLRAHAKITSRLGHRISGSHLNAAHSQNPRHIDGYASDFAPSDRSNLTPTCAPKREVIFAWALIVLVIVSPAMAERPRVLERKKAEIAEIEIPSRPVVGISPKTEQLIRITRREARKIAFSFGGFGVGVYDSTNFQRMEANGLRVDLESNPYWSPWLEAYFNTIFGRIEGKLWYQRQAFRSKNPAIAEDLMHTFFGIEIIRTVDFDLGIRLERAADFVRSGNNVDNQPLLYASLLMGKTVVLPLGDAYFLKSQLLLEGAPLSNIRSVGFIARASIGYQQLKRFFTRELEFSLRPLYQWVSPAKTQMFAHFNVAFILSWDFEVWERVRHD